MFSRLFMNLRRARVLTRETLARVKGEYGKIRESLGLENHDFLKSLDNFYIIYCYTYVCVLYFLYENLIQKFGS